MAKSLQDRLNQRRSSTFIGREQHLGLFKQNLNTSLDSEDYYFIFNIHGQGGVGKTTLVSKFQELAKDHQALVAYVNEDIREIPDLLAAVAKQFKEQGAPLKKLEERHRIYLQEKKRLEADPEAPSSTWAFGGKMLARGSKEIVRNIVPGSGLIMDQFNVDGIGEQLGEWASFLKKKVTNKDEVELLLNPITVLTPMFLEELKEYDTKSKICLFLDTYETTDIYLDEWLRQLLDGKFGSAPENILITIAGREPLNPNTWSTFADFISTISLEPFSEMEARNYLERKQVTDTATVDTIIQLSGCLPVLLEVLADKAPGSPDDVNDRCETAVERFLKWIEDPLLRDLALHSALPNLLNEDIVKHLLPEGADVGKHFEWLRSNSFVYKREDHWAYHAYVRELMLRYLKQLSPDRWEKLNEVLSNYFYQRSLLIADNEDEEWGNPDWKVNMLNYFFHQLLCKPKSTIKPFMNKFLRVLKERGIQDAIPFPEICIQAGIDSWGRILRDGVAAILAKEWRLVIPMLNHILDSDLVINPSDLAFLHFSRAFCFDELELQDEAIVDYNRALLLFPGYEDVYFNLGVVYERQKKWDKASEEYKKYLKLCPENPEGYALLGNMLRFQDQFEEAIENYLKAIDLKNDYAHAWDRLGWTLLKVHRLEEAEIALQNAWEFCNHTQGNILMNLGHLAFMQGNTEVAIDLYVSSHKLFKNNEAYFKDLDMDYHWIRMNIFGIEHDRYKQITDLVVSRIIETI